jgi:hypothetical protein
MSQSQLQCDHQQLKSMLMSTAEIVARQGYHRQVWLHNTGMQTEIQSTNIAVSHLVATLLCCVINIQHCQHTDDIPSVSLRGGFVPGLWDPQQ